MPKAMSHLRRATPQSPGRTAARHGRPLEADVHEDLPTPSVSPTILLDFSQRSLNSSERSAELI